MHRDNPTLIHFDLAVEEQAVFKDDGSTVEEHESPLGRWRSGAQEHAITQLADTATAFNAVSAGYKYSRRGNSTLDSKLCLTTQARPFTVSSVPSESPPMSLGVSPHEQATA